MKRPMTLVAGILGIVSHALNLVFAFINMIGVFAVLDMASESSDAMGAVVAAIILVVVSLAISIVGLIFSILATASWKKSHDLYKAKKGKIIVAIVFAVLGIVASYLVSNIIVAIFTTLMFAAATALLIVDLCLENKRAGNVAEVAEAAPVAEEAPKASALEEKIEKLNDMKAQGMINEEEYEELKKKYIKDQIGM